MKTLSLFSAITLLAPATQAAQLLDNGSFETSPTTSVQDFIGNGTIVTYYDADAVAAGANATNRIDGWHTTAADEEIEIWNNGNFLGVNSFDGTKFAEINANQTAELYQETAITNGDLVDYLFYHRGRDLASEQLLFRITDLGVDGIFNGYDGSGLAQGDDSQEINTLSTAGTTDWEVVFGNDVFTANGNNYRFGFETVVGTTNSATEGNFIDAQAFGEGVADTVAAAAVPEPSSSAMIILSGLALIGRRKKSN